MVHWRVAGWHGGSIIGFHHGSFNHGVLNPEPLCLNRCVEPACLNRRDGTTVMEPS